MDNKSSRILRQYCKQCICRKCKNRKGCEKKKSHSVRLCLEHGPLIMCSDFEKRGVI